ncbi:MAG: hypothetical protein NTY19_25690 [Planctomycetota bacterium]|nr:hypothetical protein [Planctomycetota bacterium]
MNRNRHETAAALHRSYVAARSYFGYTRLPAGQLPVNSLAVSLRT